MTQDYQKIQEQILPGREKQDQIWNAIEKKARESHGKYRHIYAGRLAGGIAAAILVCVLCLPQAGFADNIKVFLNHYFEKPSSVKQNIIKNVYEDNDGHVKMQVTNMLSDGACAYLDICYKALDDTGKRWLSNAELGIDAIQFSYEGEIVGKTVGYSSKLTEYKDMASKQARYFTFCYEDFSGNFNMNKVKRILSYPMCEKKGEAKIKVSSNIDTFAYRLKGERTSSKFYQPEYLLVSKFSYGIFGKNQGVYTRINNKHGISGTYMNKDFLESPESDMINNISFVMKDGSRIKQNSMAGFSPALNVAGYDLTIATGYFYDENKSYWDKDIYFEKHTTIHPEELTGIVINDIYYNLVAEKLSK